jgi:hypothetical protein
METIVAYLFVVENKPEWIIPGLVFLSKKEELGSSA